MGLLLASDCPALVETCRPKPTLPPLSVRPTFYSTAICCRHCSISTRCAASLVHGGGGVSSALPIVLRSLPPAYLPLADLHYRRRPQLLPPSPLPSIGCLFSFERTNEQARTNVCKESKAICWSGGCLLDCSSPLNASSLERSAVRRPQTPKGYGGNRTHG